MMYCFKTLYLCRREGNIWKYENQNVNWLSLSREMIVRFVFFIAFFVFQISNKECMLVYIHKKTPQLVAFLNQLLTQTWCKAFTTCFQDKTPSRLNNMGV